MTERDGSERVAGARWASESERGVGPSEDQKASERIQYDAYAQIDHPDPGRTYTEERNGIKHVVADPDQDAGTHVCDTPPGVVTVEGPVKEGYESLLAFIADPMLCDVCEVALAQFYGIPKGKVHEERMERYG